MKYNSKVLRLISVITVVCLIAACCSMLTVSAAKYSGGSGTRKDPYLIKTADDLYNMRNNLSASFKLAATIDMKGYKTDSKYFNNGFVPIGDDSTKPFTGSFTCDSGSDGLPLYAILNLNVYNKKGELFNHDWYSETDYPDALGLPEPYFWQTALFGNTNGANIHNIYVLNAEIYSSIVGQHDGRYDELGNKVMYGDLVDKMSTAILVGTAVNTTISHCGVTGEVNGKTSHHGGLVGTLEGSNVSDSYADVSIDTGGCWHIGNFAGTAGVGTSITNCFTLGSLNASLDGYGKMLPSGASAGNGAGGFIGSITGAGVVIQNCWSAVKLSSKTKGNNFYGYTEKGGTPDAISNCFTYGEYEGKASAPSGTENKNNCYASTATKGLQSDFNAASPEEITKYFLTVKGWEKGEKYPVLTSTDMVEDAKIYVPGEEREKPEQNSENTESESTSSEKDSTSSQSVGTIDNNTSKEENTESVSENTDSENSDATESETTIETVTNENEGVDTVEFVLIAILIIMIGVVSASGVATVYSTLRSAKITNSNEEIEGDEQDEE